MDLFITGDSDSATGVTELVVEVSAPTRKHFESREYGESIDAIAVVLMCRHPSLEFKQRLRYRKGKKVFEADVMLNFDEMLSASHAERLRIVSMRVTHELPVLLSKYSFVDFDTDRFSRDLHKWFDGCTPV